MIIKTDSHDHWGTPAYIYNKLNEEFHFDFDPCPMQHDISQWDGLKCDWGKSNFVNPPYSFPNKDKFIRKGFDEWKKGKTVVFLIPACTDTHTFHKYLYHNAEIRFLEGRPSFLEYGNESKNKGTRPIMICILRGTDENKNS